MYLIWICGSRLIWSNNQSSATLWVLETCLTVGLLPLMIILITASLSSNTYNKASWREDWAFEGTESIFSMTLIFPWHFWCFLTSLTGRPVLPEIWETLLKTETIRSHNSRAGKPSNLNPVSKEMISDSVELFERAGCSFHNLWEQMYDFSKCTMFLQKWISNLQDLPAKSGSWNSPNLHCLGVLPTWQYCLYSLVWWIYEISRFRRLSQALVHFVMDRASLFTDQRISGLPIRAKYKHFRTIWEQTFDTSPTDFISSSLKWWSSMQGVSTL